MCIRDRGGGAALLQEKIVATASDQMIVIADAAKEVAQLGAFPLPVEIIPFGWQTTKALVEELLVGMDVLDRDVTLRMNGDKPLLTDEANYIVDLHLKRIGNPRQLSLVLNQIPGVVENGLFIDICDIVIIGHGDGRVTVRDINEATELDDRILFAPDAKIFADPVSYTHLDVYKRQARAKEGRETPPAALGQGNRAADIRQRRLAAGAAPARGKVEGGFVSHDASC